MVKQIKNRMPYSTSLDKNLVAKLQELSNKTRIPAAYLLDEAIEDLLKKYGKNS